MLSLTRTQQNRNLKRTVHASVIRLPLIKPPLVLQFARGACVEETSTVGTAVKRLPTILMKTRDNLHWLMDIASFGSCKKKIIIKASQCTQTTCRCSVLNKTVKN